MAAFPLREAELQQLADFSTAFARAKGLLVLSSPQRTSPMVVVSSSLLPGAVPATELAKCFDIAPLYNVLVDRVSRDAAFLEDTLDSTSKADDFVRRLLQVFRATPAQLESRVMLGVNRSDYMFHHPVGDGTDTAAAKQVELNTISSSFGALSTVVSHMHLAARRRFLNDQMADDFRATEVLNAAIATGGSPGYGVAPADAPAAPLATALPQNEALQSIAMGIAAAHSEYRKLDPEANPAVVFVVQEAERNVNDQRLVEMELSSEYGIPVVRATLAELRRRLRLGEAAGATRRPKLLLLPNEATTVATEEFLKPLGGAQQGAREVSVVYYRSGYDPEDYTKDGNDELGLGSAHSAAAIEDLCWDARLLMEMSSAIQCPSVAYQLSGTKKVQQVLAMPGALERFMTAEESARLRETFAGLWPLGEDAPDESTRLAVEEALKRPDDFVIKPQREGGGHNLYGAEVASALKSMGKSELSAYILMQRLRPRPQAAALMKKVDVPSAATSGRYQVETGPALHELGIFGIFLGAGTSGGSLLNSAGGFILRAKPLNVDEGGVAAGYACLSSPMVAGSSAEVASCMRTVDSAYASNLPMAAALKQSLLAD